MNRLLPSPIWIAKFLIGHQLVAAAFFALLAIMVNVSIQRMLQPFSLMLIPAIAFALLMHSALKYRDRPRSFSASLSMGFAVYLLCFLAILFYSLRGFGLFPQGSSAIILWCGFVGVVIASVTVFYLARRRLKLQNDGNREQTAGGARLMS